MAETRGSSGIAQDVSLNGEWRIAVDPDDAGEARNWFTEMGYPEAAARPIQVPGNIYEAWPRHNGISWYRRSFTAPKREGPARAYLRFASCQYRCRVWLNALLLGDHEGGGFPFEFDVTDRLAEGSNLVVLRVENPKGSLMGGPGLPISFSMGGLTQGVTLAVRPPVRIIDVFARPDWKTGAIPLEVTIENNTGATVTVRLDAASAERRSGSPAVSRREQLTVAPGQGVHRVEIMIPRHRLWSLEDPFLYTVAVTVEANGQRDRCEVPRVGFRDFRINDNGYFELNGRRIFVRCCHSNVYDPISIQGTPREMSRVSPDFAQLKRAGFNMFREIIYSALPEQLDLADDLGFLVYNEHEGSWCLKDTSTFALCLAGVARRDRNHPSLVLWGMLNETNAGPVHDAARGYLPELRKIDDTRLVALSSGRFDKELTTGSFSNPGSGTWNVYLGGEDPREPKPTTTLKMCTDGAGDIHIYQTYPTAWSFVRDMAELARATKPVFLSEAGAGSGFNVFKERRKLEKAGAPKDAYEYTSYVDEMIPALEKVWTKYRLDRAFPSIEDMLVESQKAAAIQRAVLFGIVRGNPRINGYSLTSLSDAWGCAEGVMDTFGEFKERHLEALQDGWARVRWCILADPLTIYPDQGIHLMTALADEDALPAGRHAARLSICGPAGTVWRKEVEIHVPQGSERPLAYPVLDERIELPGLSEGAYVVSAELADLPNARASQLDFTVRERIASAFLGGSVVTVLGLDAGIRKLLEEHGAAVRDYRTGDICDRDVILVGTGMPGDAQSWRALYARIARGAHAVFLARGVFQKDPKGTTNHWLAVKDKGCQVLAPWRHELYHGDALAAPHPFFDGLPDRLMTPGAWGSLLADLGLFADLTPPDETAAAWVYASFSNVPNRFGDSFHGGVSDGLLLGTYRHHAGRFTLNAFDFGAHLGNPSAERLLLNIVREAGRSAAKLQPLPAGYDEELDGLAIAGEG